MPLEVNFQQSLFGKTSWELCYQETGWILEPCCNLSQTPKFQCLLPGAGPTLEWCEAEAVTCAGVCWTPSIGQTPGWPGVSGCSSWRILEADVPQTYYLSPVQCSHSLRLAERAGGPPPKEIEQLLLKQGGRYQSSTPFSASVCGERQKGRKKRPSETASDYQLTLFPLF